MIFPLVNIIKNFDWGCLESLNVLFDIPNPKNQPQAELWMGDHPLGCSKVKLSRGNEILLSELIANNPDELLGSRSNGVGLPFLMKILAADKPLSLQVHPSKVSAREGFEKENIAGIPVDSPIRNYKDPNHKPELVFAITNYLAMNGFREINKICELFTALNIHSLSKAISKLKRGDDEAALRGFFSHLMRMSKEEKSIAIQELKDGISHYARNNGSDEIILLVQEMAHLYAGDVGVFSPLLFNIIELQPGEAMFLHAETPHAYIRGTAIEVMACSDNVLRAGLTPKHIDVEELLKNTNFTSTKYTDLKLEAKQEGSRTQFPVPIDDFKFEIINIHESSEITQPVGPEILLCLEGDVLIEELCGAMKLSRGQSVFIAADTDNYALSGIGKVARAYQ